MGWDTQTHGGFGDTWDRHTDAQDGLGSQQPARQPVLPDGRQQPALAEEVGAGDGSTDGPGEERAACRQRAGRAQAGYEKNTGRIQAGYGQGRCRTQGRVCAGPRPQQVPPYPKIMKKKVSGRSKGKSILRSLLKIAAMVSGEAGEVLRGGQEVLGGPHPAQPCLARC